MSLIGDLAAPFALIASPVRAIGYIIPDTVVEELHSDDLAITDHPVESGAAISDHAFKLPSRLQMRCGFSNSTAGTEGYVQAVYQQLLRLQAMREPFEVYTGKRVYQSKLLAGVRVETSNVSEYSLFVVCDLREILITYTQQTAAGSESAANPQDTKGTSENGGVQPQDTAGTFNPGSNTGFLQPEAGSGLGITVGGVETSVGDMYVEGVGTIPNTLPPAYSSGVELSRSTNLGLFSNYGATALEPRANSPF